MRCLVNNVHVLFFYLFSLDIIARAGERAISRAQYDMNFVSCVIRSQTLIYDVTFTFFHKRRIRDGQLEKLWGEEEYSSYRNFFRHQISCMKFFRP